MGIARRLEPRERTALLVLLVAFCLFGVFDHSLWAPNDSREGAMVWEMYTSGHWTKLSLNGAPFLEKPPLLHWTALFFCRLFGGVSEGLVRLPAALYGCGALLVVWRWGCMLGRERAGILAAFLCATTLLYAEYSRIVLTDICLTFMVTLGLFLFSKAYTARSGRAPMYAAFLLATALAFYAKGVLGPGLVIASVLVFLVLRREWKLALLLPCLGFLLLAAVVAPWALALYREGGSDDLIGVFVDNQLGRFFALPRGAEVTSLPIVGRFLGFMVGRPIPPDPYFVHKEPIYFYLWKLPIFWLPWTLLVPPAIAHWFARDTTLTSPLSSLLRCALITILVVLHVSSAKVACYALPLFPILFLMVGVWCEDELSSSLGAFSSWMSRITFAVVRAVMFVVPSAYLVAFALPASAWRGIETALGGAGVRASLGELPSWLRAPGAIAAWRGAGACAIALLVAMLAMRSVRRSIDEGDRAGGLLKLVAAFTVVVMLSLWAVMPAWDHQRTYKPMAEVARAEIAAGRRIALAVGQEKDVGEFIYYADARLPEVSLFPGVREFLELGDGPRGVIVHQEDLDALRESLAGIDHAIVRAPEGSGQKSQSFCLITRG
jgi:4-amino-4-deoxy-L-arabinose transferase-like glycosyltransferase